MKPFNLKEALEGKPVITRDGREVTQLHLFEIPEDDYSLVGVINKEMSFWNKEGMCFTESSNYQLFMSPMKTRYYVKIVQTNSGSIVACPPTKVFKLPGTAEKLITILEFEIDE